MAGRDTEEGLDGIANKCSCVFRSFQEGTPSIFVRIYRPERDMLHLTMPVDFYNHCPTCVVIMDYFEIFIEHSNLLARAQTYSIYKHHNTAKYLIGITPQGSVSFISKGWGGQYLTENCGILNYLLPGDTVMAEESTYKSQLVFTVPDYQFLLFPKEKKGDRHQS